MSLEVEFQIVFQNVSFTAIMVVNNLAVAGVTCCSKWKGTVTACIQYTHDVSLQGVKREFKHHSATVHMLWVCTEWLGICRVMGFGVLLSLELKDVDQPGFSCDYWLECHE